LISIGISSFMDRL